MKIAILVSTALATVVTASLPLVAAPEVDKSATVPLYGQWRSCLIGGGGYLQNVLLTSDPSVVYAYMDVGGAFRSDDGGKSWRMLGAGIKGNGQGVTNARDLSVNPRDTNDVLLAVGDQWAAPEGVFRSRDGGKTWQKTLTAPFYGNQNFRWAGQNLARSPLDSRRVIAVSGVEGAFVSADDGATWKPCGLEGIYPTDIKWARDGKTVWVCAQPQKMWHKGKQLALRGGLFRSDDGGASWNSVREAAPSEVVQDPQKPERWWGIWDGRSIQTSSDGGKSWLPASEGLPQAEANENTSSGTSEKAFGALAAGPNFLLTASNRGTFYRLDLPSKQWQKLAFPQVTEVYEGRPWGSRMQPGKWQHFGSALGSISIDPRNPQRWFFTDWYAIYRSEDAGKSWNLSMDGIEATVIHTLRAAPNDPARVHLGMADNGYFSSIDGGTWFQKAEVMSNTKSIATNRQQPDRLIAVGDAGDGKWEAKQVWLTADAGQHWAKSPMSGLPSGLPMNSVTTVPDDSQRAYVAVAGEVKAGSGGVYASGDGGQSWKWDAMGLEGGALFAEDIFSIGQEIASLPSGELLLLSQKRNALFWRPATGNSWEKVTVNLTGNPYEVAAGEEAFWVAVRGDGLYRIQNGVAREVWDGDASRVAVDGKRIAIGTKEGVELSLDGGQKWVLDGDLPHRFWPIVAFAGERLLVGTMGNGAFWKPLSPPAVQTPVARPVEPREVQFEAAPQQLLQGKFGQPWAGAGKLQVTTQGAITTLRSETEGSYGSMSLPLPKFTAQTFLGAVRVEGKVEEALVALQAFDAKGKQVSWQTLVDGKSARDWRSFATRATWPQDAVNAVLVVTLKGDGAISVQGLGTSEF